MSEKLSTDETELYDRQIRLWGIKSQEKLRAANILLIGARGLGSEIAKNILLSGINSLTILDDGDVTEEELIKNFLLTQDSIGKKIAEAVLIKAQTLNPLVKITADVQPFSEKPDEYFKDFTIIVATGLTSKQMLHLDSLCRPANIKLICGDVFGMFGFSISDFQEHEYYVDQVKLPNQQKRTHQGYFVPTSEVVSVKVNEKLSYPSFSKVLIKMEKEIVKGSEGRRKRRNELYYLMRLLIQFRDQNGRNPHHKTKIEDLLKLKEIREKIVQMYHLNEEKLKENVLNLVFGEITPICAIVGGIIAQEAIKAVSHKEVPIHNVFLLNPFTFSGREEPIGI